MRHTELTLYSGIRNLLNARSNNSKIIVQCRAVQGKARG